MNQISLELVSQADVLQGRDAARVFSNCVDKPHRRDRLQVQHRTGEGVGTDSCILDPYAMAILDASPPERPCHHQRELFLPERVAV